MSKPKAESFLEKRAEQAHAAVACCALCPRACAVDRTAGEMGFCGLDDRARCFREVLHYGEESELVPSHQVYFSGCNLRCEWCAVGEWNAAPEAAPVMDPIALAACIRQRRRQGARTLNLLGGEPTLSLPGILDLLAQVTDAAAIVWNSNMYFSPDAARLLDGVVDVYLADFKCGNKTCAGQLLGADDYVDVVKDTLQFARRSADLIVRYVVLPGHTACCAEPIFNWLKETMPEAKVSIRRDYMPPARADKAPARLSTREDVQEAAALADALGLNVIE